MNTINKQINRARRRMLIGTFFRTVCWSIFAGWIIAAIAIAVPKIWHLEFLAAEQQFQTWCIAWIAGGATVGILFAFYRAYSTRETMVSAAVEVDKRYKLRERLSSAMSLDETDASSNAGAALIADADKRAETIDVRDEFRFQPSWKTLLPLAPIILCIGILFVPNAVAEEVVDPETNAVAKNNAKTAVEEARKKLKEKLKNMEAKKGLGDSKFDLKPLMKKIDKLGEKTNMDKKDTLIELNNIKKMIDERRKKMGGDAKGLKNNLKKMQDVSKGPGKQLNDALKDGNFEDAKKAIKDLVKKLKAGKLSKIEKQQLIKNMDKMADQLKKMIEKHKKDQEQLKKKIEEAIKKGDMQAAAKMQQQLEKKQQQNKQMQKMKKMAQKMKECANCMNPGQKGKKGGNKPGGKPGDKPGDKSGSKPGEKGSGKQSEADMQKAADMLEEMQEMMEGMGDELEELQDLEDMMEDIDMAKNECQGQGGGKSDKPSWNDWGKGEGQGGGKRSRKEEDTGHFKARVKAKLQRGETVKTGNADGDNITGKTVSEARELIKTSMSDKTDPMEIQNLPRSQREHVQQYFNNLRDQRNRDNGSNDKD